MNTPQRTTEDTLSNQYFRELQRFLEEGGENSEETIEINQEREALLYVLHLQKILWKSIKEGVNPSLVKVFETALTISEFIEFNRLGDARSERAIFLGSIYGGDLKRSDAEVYARLKTRKENGEVLTDEEYGKLEIFERVITERSDRIKRELEEFIKMNPDIIAQNSAVISSQEIATNIIGIIGRAS